MGWEGPLRNNRHRAGSGIIVSLLAVLTCGCSSTIHKEAVIGDTDTLSVDAKQRLLFVGTRVAQTKHGVEPKSVRCAEPSPDAMVAMQAVLSASGKASGVGSAGGGGSGAVAARSTEAAASIGFRDSSIQMLRDSYFRLCEAYMNGVLTDAEYEHMVTNADTYLAVASALQIIGSNPVAPTVAISAGGGTTSASLAEGNALSANAEDAGSTPAAAATPGPASQASANPPDEAANAKKRAQMTKDVVHQYLSYRHQLMQETEPDLQRDRLAQKAGPRYPIAPYPPPPPPFPIHIPW
jgi:hypothetical protein